MRRPTNRRLSFARTRKSFGWVKEARRLNVDPSLALDLLKRRVIDAILKEIYSVSLVALLTTDSDLMSAFDCGEAVRGGRAGPQGRYITNTHYFDVERA